MGIFFNIILLVILYCLGIIATLYGSHLLDWHKYLILLIAFTLSLIAYYLRFYKPLINLKESHLTGVMEALFHSLHTKYKEMKPGPHDLRINVMRLRKSLFSNKKSYLKIDFLGGSYSDSEKEQKYLVNIGCCGTCIHENAQIFFDARQNQEPYKGMTPTQREITNHVKSILSTAIYKSKDDSKTSPIAVLNLDSSEHITTTCFNEEEIQKLALTYSRLIGSLF